MSQVKVAVFGCGQHARAWHLKVYAGMPEVRLVAVVDTDLARAREAAAEFGAEGAYADHREALEKGRPDLVSIVTPPAFHHRMALDAFAAGAHVLCEKPIAMNAREAWEMTRAAEAAGRFLSMGLQTRHLPETRAVRECVRERRLGDVFFTRVWCGHIMNIPGWGHFHRKDLAGGGVVMATTVHILDAALWMLGNPKPASVLAFHHARLPRMTEPAVTWDGPPSDCDIEDFSHAVVRFEDGSRMSVESNWLLHPSTRPGGVEILMNDGRAWLHPLKIERSAGTKVVDETPEVTANPDPVGDFLREAVRCAQTGEPTIVRPDQIVQVQSVIDAMYESAEAGCEIFIKPPW